MVEQRPITGVVVSYIGTSPGPASQIRYAIDTNLPSGVVRLTDQRPLDAYPDEVDVIARQPGRGVIGILKGAQGSWTVEWEFVELLAFGLCPGVTPPPGLSDLMGAMGGTSPNTINPGGGPSTAGGSPGSNSPGPGAGGFQ